MVTVTNYGAPPFQPGMASDAFIPDQLVAGDLKIVTDTITIVSGAGALKRGTVLGKITASGKYTTALAASEDGSETPAAILVDDVDATSADATGGIYKQIEVNGNALILGTGITLTAAKSALESDASTNIYVKTPVSAADPT
jgi:hypothetical protein